MKVCVFSDSHGYAGNMIAAIELEDPDLCFFLGDGERDIVKVGERFPDLPIYAVRGNCDLRSELSRSLCCAIGGVVIFATHGHLSDVKYDGRPIYKVVFMCSDAAQLNAAKAELEDEFMFLVQDMAGANCLNGELINRKFDKGSGVRLVAETYGYDIAYTIGFGDSMNDLEMIETVGTSVCMDNGSPKLKELSDLICPAVTDDGLEWGFKKLGLI